MTMQIKKISLGVVVLSALFTATTASAYTVTVGGLNPGNGTGLHSAVTGAVETDFEAGQPANYVGGAVVLGSWSHHHASPPGDASKFFTVAPDSPTQSSPGIAYLSSLSRYFGYFGGSPDTYNSVEFWRGSTQLFSINGTALAAFAGIPANGDWSSGAYWNIWADNPSEYFNVVKFVSSGIAFETDNHAVATIPLPAALPLMLSGLGVLGFASRRRKATEV